MHHFLLFLRDERGVARWKVAHTLGECSEGADGWSSSQPFVVFNRTVYTVQKENEYFRRPSLSTFVLFLFQSFLTLSFTQNPYHSIPSPLPTSSMNYFLLLTNLLLVTSGEEERDQISELICKMNLNPSHAHFNTGSSPFFIPYTSWLLGHFLNPWNFNLASTAFYNLQISLLMIGRDCQWRWKEVEMGT